MKPLTQFERAIVDTSVFVAGENGRSVDIDRLPKEAAVSVVTLAELHAGVLAASEIDVRSRRMATLQATAHAETLPIDDSTALAWARLRVHLAEAGRRVNINDLWIAATALAQGLPVVTQDRDFDPLEGVGGLKVFRV